MGASSLLCTILMLAIIQGLYILREDEDEEFEKRKQEAIQRLGAGETINKRARCKKRRRRNKGYTGVSFFFIIIFMGLIGYLIYFNTIKSDDFINSPYNTRQDTFADRVVRGKIMSSDGEVLAQTNVSEDGAEKRSYPYNNVFAHVVGYDSNGKSGLESEANFQLLSSHEFFLNQIRNEFMGTKNTGDTVVSTLNAEMPRPLHIILLVTEEERLLLWNHPQEKSWPWSVNEILIQIQFPKTGIHLSMMKQTAVF